MHPILEHFSNQLATIQSTGANPNFLRDITVPNSYLKQAFLIKDSSRITKLDPQTLRVVPYNLQDVPDFAKAIDKANLGVQTIKSADCILVKFPMLTQDRRKELAKLAKEKAETAKVSVRQERKKLLDVLKTQNLSSDQQKLAEKQIQIDIDGLINQIDTMLSVKEKSILE